ncbi:PDZ domain-containing protein [Sporosarcina aquimarina]|uniref:SpoIVB peptidase S55 domain-containing protein n=1 Tax=Sporosarcina aquimarina TaxID=114975 RepID=UPI00204098C8|nr:SpoIVB peptidase S55 domain-containing protein [Sporosarcina aquimarina]MCM3757041.1 PDZ domain-containing protein [Sporosarcina aquimarina]
MEWSRQLKLFMASVVMIVGMSFSSIVAFAASSSLIPMGNSIGIQLELAGVFVTSDVPLSKKNASLKAGDQLVSIDGTSIESLKTLNEKVGVIEDESVVKLVLKRDENDVTVEADGLSFKRALPFLKDTTEGTGTLTYVDLNDGTYGALGHQIIDSSLNSAPNFDSGSIYLSEIEQIKKSTPGNPGYKISSIINQDKTLGSILTNSVYGIFGDWNTSYKEVLTEPLEVMQPTELTVGKAEILTTIQGTEVESFEIEISKLSNDSFQFKLTDKRLLEKTGGILQGMSGSPVIQKGKFVGAVTHMFVDEPEKGAGLFLGKMTEVGAK